MTEPIGLSVVPAAPEDSLRLEYHESLVEPGEYQVAFERDEKARMYNREVWYVTMRIVSGPHLGLPLLFPLNALPKGKRPTPACGLYSAFAVGTDHRPPRDLWRRRPKAFLATCVFSARVRTVTRDSKRVERPRCGT